MLSQLSSNKRALALSFLAATCCCVLTGCLVPASRVAAYRSQYNAICERNKALQSELANLDAHSRGVEDQLRQAEEELSSLDRRGRADQRRLANYERERAKLYRGFADSNGVPLIVSDQIAGLADRYPSLYYDVKAGVAKLDTDVLFDTAESKLRPEAGELLSEFASILRTSEGKNLRIMVVGHTDDQRIEALETNSMYPNNWHLGAGRALAVCDFLRVRGIPEDRMGLASYGKYQPVASNTSPGNRQKNRRVELFLVAPDVPVVGWTETFTSVYR